MRTPKVSPEELLGIGSWGKAKVSSNKQPRLQKWVAYKGRWVWIHEGQPRYP